MPKTVLIVIGTRPEAIKLVPLVLELRGRPDDFQPVICVTGQHRQLLDQVLESFQIQPDFDLSLMEPDQSLGRITSRAIDGLDDVFRQVRPDIVIVQGDTTSAFCGGLVGHYHQTTVAHVEAGLRTGNKFAPFPEEMNRRLVGRLADLHFAPTQQAADNLRQEGVAEDTIFVTGNTVIDTLLLTRQRVVDIVPRAATELAARLADQRIVLVTGHRRENHGTGLDNICQAIRSIADRFPDTMFVYPVHLNPNVQQPVRRILGNHDRILLIDPLDYEPFFLLMNRADIVLTDSGGVQEEAPSFGKPVLVMRETTERPEGVAAGNALLVGTNQAAIEQALAKLLSDPVAYATMSQASNPYGDGTASRQIADVLAATGTRRVVDQPPSSVASTPRP